MKYLKKFESISTDEEIKINIEDILIDFTDRYIPLNVNFRTWDEKQIKQISIHIGDQLMDFDDFIINIQQCEDDFLRLDKYLQSEGYKLNAFGYEERGDYIAFKKEPTIETLVNLEKETNYVSIYYRK